MYLSTSLFNVIVKYYNINYRILQFYKLTNVYYTFTSHFVLKPANINVMAVSAVQKARTETTCCKHCTLPMQSVKTYLITNI